MPYFHVSIAIGIDQVVWRTCVRYDLYHVNDTVNPIFLNRFSAASPNSDLRFTRIKGFPAFNRKRKAKNLKFIRRGSPPAEGGSSTAAAMEA